MPTPIVAATCPLPACNLASRDVEALVADLSTYVDAFLPDFSRKDQAPLGASLPSRIGERPSAQIDRTDGRSAWLSNP